jgi:hypothetical protein
MFNFPLSNRWRRIPSKKLRFSFGRDYLPSIGTLQVPLLHVSRGNLTRALAREISRLLQFLLIASLTYWGAFALLSPVTTWDSQIYNLGRLAIADLAGFWGNQCWFSERQVIFPWAFDAVHYPFVKVGFCESLPSFFCLIGLLVLVYRILCERYSRRFALWSCLSLISMPTFIYQATATKNDFVIVFLVGCWFYALWRYQREQVAWLAAASGLSLGFLCGAKTSGLFLCPFLFLISVFWLRRQRLPSKWFFVSFAASIILFGSVETYLLSRMRYGHALGPPRFVRDHSNRDALRGGAANFIRYYVGSVSCGVYTGFLQKTFCVGLENAARFCLNATRLQNAGYRGDFTDAGLVFWKTGGNDRSDYGAFGFLSFTLSLAIPFLAPRNSIARACALGGLASLLLICFTVAWMPWNARFLLLPFSLFALATMVFAFQEARSQALRRVVQSVILFSIVITPFVSWDKKPGDLLRCLFDRRQIEFSERPALLPVYEEVVSLAPLRPRIYLAAGSDSWVLPFLRIKNIDWHLACDSSISLASSAGRIETPTYLLTLDGPTPFDPKFQPCKQFGPGNSLCVVNR